MNKFFIVFFILSLQLWSKEANLFDYIQEILRNDLEFQQKENKLNFAQSKTRISLSDHYFDIFFEAKTKNITAQRNQNEYDLFSSTPNKIENSEIYEFNEDISVGISRKFFPKDFDNDVISNRLAVWEMKTKMFFFEFRRINNIFDEFIKRKEADWQLEILSDQIIMNKQTNDLLQKLYEQKLASAKQLKSNLEERITLENKIIEWKNIKQNLKFNENFYVLFNDYISNCTIEIDSTKLQNAFHSFQKKMEKQIESIRHDICLQRYFIFLPETDIKLSYNKKTSLQDWTITESVTYLRDRDEIEEYPEIGLNITLPFDIFNNSRGKYQLLKSFRKKAEIQQREMTYNLQVFRQNLLSEFSSSYKIMKLKENIWQLAQIEYKNFQDVFQQDSRVYGSNPEFELIKKRIEQKISKIEFEIAKMYFYKNCFLQQYLMEKI